MTTEEFNRRAAEMAEAWGITLDQAGVVIKENLLEEVRVLPSDYPTKPEPRLKEYLRLMLPDEPGPDITSPVKIRLGLLWDALDALRMDFDRTGEHDRANSILAAQEHVEALQREVGGL